MSEHGLTSEDLKKQHGAEITEVNTFKTHGVSEQAAKDYLDTPEGARFWQKLAEADPRATTRDIDERAISQIISGRDLPRMEVINEPLVKIVPAGESVSPYSPFFAKRSEFEDALAKGHNLSERFGLPIKSEATVYDVYEIRPKGPTEVFVSRVAPTSELGGQVAKAGGAEQYLVPNRGLYSEATRVTSLGNDLGLHRDLVVSKGLGAPIVAAEAVAARGLRGGTAAKGLGAAGVVVTAYDAADTFHDAARLRSQGNDTAAQARVERFAIQNAAGWTGAATFAGIGASAGVKSGPGLLVTGALGGVIGAVAGDKVSDWINERKVNHQQDPQGNTWTFDPDHSEKGWTRTLRELDTQAMSATTVDMPIYQTRTLTADVALSDQLTWQASRTSIELALGAPPQGRDPYTLAANEQDARSAREAPWSRDPDTRQWTREVSRIIDYRHNNAVYEKHLVEASPQRAAELERESQSVIAKNATQTPAVMAAQFQAAHEQNGWSRHGALPEAVTGALQHPGRIVGSDGNLYERNAQGQWTHDGLLWDSQAKGNLRHELEDTYHQQQADARIPTLETVRATAAPLIQDYEATQTQQAPHAPPPLERREAAPKPAAPATPSQVQAMPAPVPEHLRDFRHPEHPLHSRYTRFLAGLEKADAGYLQNKSNLPHYTPEQRERLAAGLTATPGITTFAEVGQFHLDQNGTLWASNLPPNVFDTPGWVSVPLDQTLAQTPDALAERWRQQNVPAPTATIVQQSLDPRQLPATDLRHPEHSHHGLFAQTRATLSNEYARWGMQPDPARLDREAACCVVAARDERMSQVGGLQLNFPEGQLGRPAVMLRQNPADEFSARASVSATELAQAPEVARSSLQLQAVEQQLALLNQQDQQDQQRSQEREMQTSARMV